MFRLFSLFGWLIITILLGQINNDPITHIFTLIFVSYQFLPLHGNVEEIELMAFQAQHLNFIYVKYC